MLNSILTTTLEGEISIESLLICSIASILLGLGISLIYMVRNTYNKNFVVTLALMPVIVQTVIMMVNGNLGAGVAVMGAFSLVRFRSVPGSAKEIGCIFFAMAIGLATGMGYIAFAFLLLVLIGGAMLLLTFTKFGEPKQLEKSLKITIPENLDYNGLFDDVFSQYVRKAELTQVKTSNMGSLFELGYCIVLKSDLIEKDFLDQLRCRNGNLNIVCSRVSTLRDEL